MARVCEGEGADGLSLVNTLQALDIDIETRRPVLSNVLRASGPRSGGRAAHGVAGIAACAFRSADAGS